MTAEPSYFQAQARSRKPSWRRTFARWVEGRRRRSRWIAGGDLDTDFFRAVTTTKDMHDFFHTHRSAPDISGGIPQTVAGHCYICLQDVDFTVDVHQVEQWNSWRETLICPECGLMNRWRSSIHLFEALFRPLPDDRIFMTEAVTPLYYEIAKRHSHVVGSEFSPDVEPGRMMEWPSGPVRIEDVTRLTFDDCSFEAVLTFDVLEHVPDYHQALRELHRVLVRGGQVLISVPSTFNDNNLKRAVINAEGEVEHLLEPLYHGDPLSDQGVLCFHDFGMEFLDDLKRAGFADAFAVVYSSLRWCYPGEQLVFVGRKG